MILNLAALDKRSYGDGATCMKLRVVHFSVRSKSEKYFSGRRPDNKITHIITKNK